MSFLFVPWYRISHDGQGVLVLYCCMVLLFSCTGTRTTSVVGDGYYRNATTGMAVSWLGQAGAGRGEPDALPNKCCQPNVGAKLADQAVKP